ncbi:MAG: winged helix-turn-helix domain-containing protein [Planctomycetota bacterium]
MFGPGRADLIEAIARTGSIREACQQTGMQYRKARSFIKRMEERLGEALTLKMAGGPRGGGTRLTPFGFELLRKYRELEKGWNQRVDEKFERLFLRSGGETGEF